MGSKLSGAVKQCGNIVTKQDRSVSLFSINEKCTVVDAGSFREVNNVGLGRSNQRMKESSVSEDDDGIGDNMIIKGSKDKMPMKCCNITLSDMELKAAKNNDLLRVQNVDEPVKKSNNKVLNPLEPDSPTSVADVSRGNIGLVEELFGPETAICDINFEKKVASENTSREKDSDKENMYEEEDEEERTYSIDAVRKVGGKIKKSDVISKQEHVFGVGDLVWVKTRTSLWWPGIISDNHNATNSEKSRHFFVSYFASANSTWSSGSDLKPFVEYFDQMSRQNGTSNFNGAVEKGLGLIGEHVRSKMNCNCSLKEIKTPKKSTRNEKESSTSLGKTSKLDDFAVSKFNPASFLASIKDLARVASASSKLRLTVTKNRLSAFYSSVGHLHLPLQVLKQTGDYVQITPDGVKLEGTAHTTQKRNHEDETCRASDNKGSASRGRKKSRYLSFPYVDINKEIEVSQTSGKKETEDSSDPPSQPSKSRPKGDGGSKGKISKRKKSKPGKGSREISKGDDINLRYGSAELMNDAEVVQKDETGSTKEDENEKIDLTTGGGSSNGDVSDKFTVNVDCSSKETIECTEKCRKRAEQVENCRKSFFDSLSNSANSSCVISFEQRCSDMPKITETPSNETIEQPPGFDPQNMTFEQPSGFDPQNMTFKPPPGFDPQNTTFEPPPGFNQVDMSSDLPDLNENCPSFSVDPIHSEGSFVYPYKPIQGKCMEQLISPNKKGVDLTKACSSSLSSKNVQETVKSDEHVNNSHDVRDIIIANAERETVLDVTNIGFRPFKMRDMPSAIKPHRSKRKLEEMFSENDSKIPDLNESAVETSSQATTAKKDKSASIDSGSDKNVNKSLNTKEDPGAILVLQFSPEFALPSKEHLISTFSRYGLVNESETLILNDSIAQIFYERTPDARFAFRSLEKTNPYGALLYYFKLYRKPFILENEGEKSDVSEMPQSLVPLDAHENTVKVQKKNPRQNNSLLKNVLRAQQKSGVHNDSKKVLSTPDIALMRKNVEVMKSALEKAGHKLLPDVRLNLENEIKGFLDKISSMTTSSPSS